MIHALGFQYKMSAVGSQSLAIKLMDHKHMKMQEIGNGIINGGSDLDCKIICRD